MTNRILKSTAGMLFLTLSGSMVASPVLAQTTLEDNIYHQGLSGYVKFYNAFREYGVVEVDQWGGREIYLMKHNINTGSCGSNYSKLTEGRRVKFSAGIGTKGWEARDVTCSPL